MITQCQEDGTYSIQGARRTLLRALFGEAFLPSCQSLEKPDHLSPSFLTRGRLLVICVLRFDLSSVSSTGLDENFTSVGVVSLVSISWFPLTEPLQGLYPLCRHPNFPCQALWSIQYVWCFNPEAPTPLFVLHGPPSGRWVTLRPQICKI